VNLAQYANVGLIVPETHYSNCTSKEYEFQEPAEHNKQSSKNLESLWFNTFVVLIQI